MTPLFDIQSCHARPFSGHLSSKWPFLWRSAQKKCAVEVQRCSLSAPGCIVIMRSGGAALLIIGNVRVHPSRIFAICHLLSLARLHTNSTGTADSARILRISPRLPPCQPTTTSVDQNAEACPPIIPIHSRRFIPLHRHDAYFQSLRDDTSSACIVKGINCSNFLG
jgi:hypothetical protein